MRAAAQRVLGRSDEACALYRRIADDTTCPAWVAFGWLGLATFGHDAWTPVASTLDPLELADAISAHLNAIGHQPPVHDTVDRYHDRIGVAAAAVVAAALHPQVHDAHARGRALAGYLAGAAPVKHVAWSLHTADLVRVAEARVPALADLVRTSYRVATGRLPPSVLL
jgi:hypothetical protein